MKKLVYLILVAICWNTNVFAATVTWTNGNGDNDWHNSKNWLPKKVPGSNDDIVFPAASGTCNLISAESASSITIQAGYTDTIFIKDDLTVTGDFTMNDGTVHLTSGVQSIGGNWYLHDGHAVCSSTGITVIGDLTMNAGVLKLTDQLTIQNDVNINAGYFNGDRGDLIVTGDINIVSDDQLFDCTVDCQTINVDQTYADIAEFKKSVTLASGLSFDAIGTIQFKGSDLTINGDLDVSSGTVILDTDVDLLGAVELNGGSLESKKLFQISGSMNLNAGSYQGSSGDLNIDTAINLYDGSHLFKCKTTVPALVIDQNYADTITIDDNFTIGSDFTVQHSGLIDITSGDFTVDGNLTLTSGGFNSNNNSSISNDLTINSDAHFKKHLTVGGNCTVNAGTLDCDQDVTVGGDLALQGGAAGGSGFTCGGRCDVTQDLTTDMTSSFGNDLTVGGNFTVTAGTINCNAGEVSVGGFMDLQAGSFNSSANTNVTGNFTTAVNTTITKDITVGGDLTTSTGAFSGSAKLTVSGTVDILSGSFSVSGAASITGDLTTDVSTSFGNTLSTGGNVTISGGTFDCTGTAQTIGGNLDLQSGSISCSGNVDVTGEISLVGGGTFSKDVTSGIDFSSTSGALSCAQNLTVGGDLNIPSGSMSCSGKIDVTGTMTTAVGGTVGNGIVTGGNLTVTGGSLTSSSSDVVVGGNMDIQTGPFSSAGKTNVTGSLTIAAAGTFSDQLTTGGGLTISAGAISCGNSLTVGGNMDIQSGSFSCSQNASVTGDFSTAVDASFAKDLTAGGNMTVTGGTVSVSGSNLDINGNIDISAGDVTVSATPSCNDLTISGGTVSLESHDFSPDGDLTISGGDVSFDIDNLTMNGNMVISNGTVAFNESNLILSGSVVSISNNSTTTFTTTCNLTLQGSGMSFDIDGQTFNFTKITIEMDDLAMVTFENNDELITEEFQCKDGIAANNSDFIGTRHINIEKDWDGFVNFSFGITKTVVTALDYIVGDTANDNIAQDWEIDLPPGDTVTIGSGLNGVTFGKQDKDLKVKEGVLRITDTSEVRLIWDKIIVESGGTLILSGDVTITEKLENQGGRIVQDEGTLTFDMHENENLRLQSGDRFNNVIVRGNGHDLKLTEDSLYVHGDLSILSGELKDEPAVLWGNYFQHNSCDDHDHLDLILKGDRDVTFDLDGDNDSYDSDIWIEKEPGASVTLNSSLIMDKGNKTIHFNSGIMYTTETELLELSKDDLTTKGNNNSFVDGPIRLWGKDDRTVPVGDDGLYAPVAITDQDGNDDNHFTVQYFHANPDSLYDRSSLAPTLYSVSDCEYWLIDRTFGSNEAYVTLSWKDERSCDMTNIAGLKVARWDGSLWDDHSSSNIAGTMDSGSVRSSARIVNFSPYTFGGDSGTILNVLFSNLTATVVNYRQVEVEANITVLGQVREFVVQRSNDGVNFEDLATIDLEVGIGSIQKIAYTDRNPYLDDSYYRIKSVNEGTKETYSDMVSVKIDIISDMGSSREFSVHPNPTDGNFTIATSDRSRIQEVIVYDLLGKQYQADINYHPEEVEVNIQHLANGRYFLKIISTGEQATYPIQLNRF